MVNNGIMRKLLPIPVELVVKEIVDSRYYRNQLQYKIKWQGYPDPSEDTWKSIEDLENAPDAIKNFHFTLPKQALICFSSPCQLYNISVLVDVLYITHFL
jgi:hypothetical protein